MLPRTMTSAAAASTRSVESPNVMSVPVTRIAKLLRSRSGWSTGTSASNRPPWSPLESPPRTVMPWLAATVPGRKTSRGDSITTFDPAPVTLVTGEPLDESIATPARMAVPVAIDTSASAWIFTSDPAPGAETMPPSASVKLPPDCSCGLPPAPFASIRPAMLMAPSAATLKVLWSFRVSTLAPTSTVKSPLTTASRTAAAISQPLTCRKSPTFRISSTAESPLSMGPVGTCRFCPCTIAAPATSTSSFPVATTSPATISESVSRSVGSRKRASRSRG